MRTAISRWIGRRSATGTALVLACVAAEAGADPAPPPIRQGFADSVHGQLHYLTARPAGIRRIGKRRWCCLDETQHYDETAKDRAQAIGTGLSQPRYRTIIRQAEG
jgi:hypothetical protein